MPHGPFAPSLQTKTKIGDCHLATTINMHHFWCVRVMMVVVARVCVLEGWGGGGSGNLLYPEPIQAQVHFLPNCMFVKYIISVVIGSRLYNSAVQKGGKDKKWIGVNIDWSFANDHYTVNSATQRDWQHIRHFVAWFYLKLSDTLLSKLPMQGTWFSTSNVCHSK